MSNVTEEEVFSNAGLPAREQVQEWFNVKQSIGTKIMGIFMGWWISPANKPGFKDQIGVALKTADGKVVGVSVGDTTYMRARIEPSQIGDRVGFKYESDKDTGQIQPAKIIKFYNPDLEKRRESGNVVISKPEELKASNTSAPAGGNLDSEFPTDADEEAF